MAIYRLYPTKDATLYSETRKANTGMDQILEVGRTKDGEPLRSIIEFDQEELDSVVVDIMNGTSYYSASLHLYAANVEEVPTNLVIDVLPVAESWTEGTGMYGDTPITSNGVSWAYVNGTTPWDIDNNQYYDQKLSVRGGGTWISSVDSNWNGPVYSPTPTNTVITGSYTHTRKGSVDLEADITPFVRCSVVGELENNGLLLKLRTDDFISGSLIGLKYFSSDTNTIYHPYLELKWDDSIATGSLAELDTDVCDITFKNIKKEYVDEGKVRFRIHARPKYPTKVYRTTSVYLDNYALPINSQWGIEDVATGEMVVDFDSFGTKVSKDEKGSFFDVYMDILSVERYYKLHVKTVVDGSTITVESDRTFKVVANG